MERAEEFVQLFNKVQDSLFMLTGRPRTTPFWQLVEAAALLNTAVRSNSDRLKKFAMLRNAIVHDGEYPPYIVANPSEDALAKFRLIAGQILEPRLLIPTFAAEVRCFSPTDSLVETLRYMRIRDFSQIVLRDVIGALRLITVEGITKWLAAQVETFPTGMADTVLADVLNHEHPALS